MRGFAVFGLTALFLSSAAWAHEAKSYAIDLRYEPNSEQLTATARITLKPEPQAKTVTFYLHDELQVSAVRSQGKSLVFRQHAVPYDYSYDTKANRIEVQTHGVTGGLEIVYAGRFSPSQARSPSDYMRGDHDGLYLRSYGYSLWFPVFAEDHTSFPMVDFERVRITTPKEFHAVFVGEELSRVEKGSLAVGTWQAKAVGPYDAQLTVSRFKIKRSGSLQAFYLPDPASEAAAEKVGDLAAKLVAYYNTHYRAKAAERAVYLVEEPKYGDIAGGNMIGLQESRWREVKAGGVETEVLAHELVHAFVQTPTPREDSLYAFEIEGFPSYFHLPALESVLGKAWYDAKLDRIQVDYLARRATGKQRGEMLPPEKPILAMTPDEVGTYKDVFVLNDRALLFWDYLRRKMALPVFDGLVRELTTAPDVTAKSFFALVAKHAPDLDSDAHAWLETTAYPDNFRRPPNT